MRGAPTFDGSTDFEVFVNSFTEYLADQPCMTEQLQKSLLKASCKGVAQEYLGSIVGLA